MGKSTRAPRRKTSRTSGFFKLNRAESVSGRILGRASLLGISLGFLALELVPGDTLAERVTKGPLPVEEALEVCRQIAEGVEAAH